MLGRTLAIWLAALAGCYSPPQPDCGFSCRRNGECPQDYTCQADGICHRNGSPANLVCATDARADSPRPIDAPPADADTSPPMLFASMPAGGETNVATNTTVRVQFNEPVVDVTPDSFYLSVGATPLGGAVTAIDPYTYMFTPGAALPANSTIDVNLTSAIEDVSGNALVPTMFSFQTGS